MFSLGKLCHILGNFVKGKRSVWAVLANGILMSSSFLRETWNSSCLRIAFETHVLLKDIGKKP